ncbi:MAG: amidohydrolase family protein, partial [Maribacter sp.]
MIQQKKAFFIIVLLVHTAFLSGQIKALHFGELICGNGEKITDAIVITDGDRIIKTGTSKTISIPKNAKRIDLQAYTAIPGLIDAHTHITYFWDEAPGTSPWEQLGTLGPAVTVFLAQENALKTLETGVTTIRDLGSFDDMDFSMKELVQRGKMVGPRMFVSGRGLSNRRTKGVAAVDS